MTATWLPFLLMAAMGGAPPGPSQPQNHFPLTAAQVALAVSASGMPAGAERVSLLTRVVATEPEPVLDVLSVETLGKGPGRSGRCLLAREARLSCRREMLAVLRHREFASFGPRAANPMAAVTSTAWSGRSQITMKAGTMPR